MRRLLPLALPLSILFLSAAPLLAQGPSAEVHPLGFLVGTWTFPFQGSEGTWECAWFGDTFVKCGAEVRGASGDPVETVDMFSYDTQEEVFVWHRFLTNNFPEKARGWHHGGSWTFVFDEPVGGKRRASFLVESSAALTLTWEDSVAGGDWEPRSEVRMTRNR